MATLRVCIYMYIEAARQMSAILNIYFVCHQHRFLSLLRATRCGARFMLHTSFTPSTQSHSHLIGKSSFGVVQLAKF